MMKIFIFLTGIAICFANSDKHIYRECAVGECELLHNCNGLVKIVDELRARKRITPNDRKSLEDAQCGRYNRKEHEAYYCCGEYDKNSLSTGSILKHEHLSLINSKRPKCGKYTESPTSIYPDISVSNMFYTPPWKALILNSADSRPLCSGSKINDRYILTAASCVNELSKNSGSLKVRLGDYNLITNPDCEIDRNNRKECIEDVIVDYDVEHVSTHPQFAEKELLNDIALIRVNKKMNIGGNVISVCLALNHSEVDRANVPELHGWGISIENGANRDILHRMLGNILTNEECQQLYKNKREIREEQFCIAHNDRFPNVHCIEDNGGSASRTDDYRNHVQIGVASFPKEGCHNELPSVYTNVGYYTEWILNTIRP